MWYILSFALGAILILFFDFFVIRKWIKEGSKQREFSIMETYDHVREKLMARGLSQNEASWDYLIKFLRPAFLPDSKPTPPVSELIELWEKVLSINLFQFGYPQCEDPHEQRCLIYDGENNPVAQIRRVQVEVMGDFSKILPIVDKLASSCRAQRDIVGRIRADKTA